MAKHKKEEVDARIEEVGQLRARSVPVADIAAKFDVTDRQVRLDFQEWLRRRKAERAADGLQLEEVLAQCEEVVSAAWHDHELLGAGMTSLDPKTARARSELLRIALSAIDRKVSLVGLSTRTQEEGAEAPGKTPMSGTADRDGFWREVRGLAAVMRRDCETMMNALRRGENVPEFRPPGPGEDEDIEALFEFLDRYREEKNLRSRDSHSTEVPQDGEDGEEPSSVAE